MASAVKPNRERPVVAVPTDAGTTARCARDIENRTLERSRATSTRLREGRTVMISVVTVEDRPGTITWQRRRQYAAAAGFIGSSLLWFVSDLASRAAHGVGRVPFTQAHPQLVGLAISADM